MQAGESPIWRGIGAAGWLRSPAPFSFSRAAGVLACPQRTHERTVPDVWNDAALLALAKGDAWSALRLQPLVTGSRSTSWRRLTAVGRFPTGAFRSFAGRIRGRANWLYLI
jgi:hypothetical protein